MVINRTMTMKGLPGHFRRLSKAVPAEASTRITRVAQHFAEKMKAKTTVQDIVDRGSYRNAWKYTRLPLYLTAMTYNSVVDRRSGYGYSTIVELGRRAGARRPPVRVIRDWIVRRWGRSVEEANKIAGAVATKIGRDGIKPRAPMTDTEAVTTANELMNGYMRLAMNAALARR